MKKIDKVQRIALFKVCSKKTFRIMKLSTFLLFVTIFNVFGNKTYSQNARLNLDMKDVPIQTILNTIEGQSEFFFLYSSKMIDINQKVDINIADKKITEVLDELLANTNIKYAVRDRQILLFNKEAEAALALQQNRISGTVTDESGSPLQGVTVQVKGTTIGALTDASGKYNLNNAPQDATLVFSFIGMATQEITSEGRNLIDVVLKEAAIGLEEVVVVGYGTQKKVNLTGAVDVITNKVLVNRQASTVSQLLQGLSPGTNFVISGTEGYQPGATMDITIRGIGSLNGGKPYILIDGFPGSINNLNPEDIESVSVLKDAAASAIYGARAPYGVILITTKKGEKNKKISVTYSGNVSISTPQPLPKMLDSYTWVRVLNESGDNRGGHPFSDATVDRVIAYQNKDWEYLRQSMPNWPAGATNFGAFPNGNVWDNAALNYANTDWYDVYYGSGINQKHDFSLQGGSNNASYFLSAGYLDQNGVLNYGIDKFQRVNVVGKFDLDITDWWNFSWETRLNQNHREKSSFSNQGGYDLIFWAVGKLYPVTPLYDGWGNIQINSQIPLVDNGINNIKDLDLWQMFKTKIQPVKGWEINADFAYNLISGFRSNHEQTAYTHYVDNTVFPIGITVPNSIQQFYTNNNYWTMNLYSSYNFDIKNIHNFYILAGTQFENGRYNAMDGSKTVLITDAVPSLQTATGTAILTESLSHSALEGYFARFSYNYKEKYLLEANARYDGSYVFRKDNRWGLFPSFSVGWNVNKEPFWDNVAKYINTLKLRASLGQLGNQNVSPYSDIDLVPMQTGKLNWIFNYGQTRPTGYTSAPALINRNLTWETATTKNIGVNMSFLNNKLTADLDLFERITSEMIGPSEAKPGVLGASVPRSNNSSLRTRGWEIALQWKQGFNSGFSYFINLNLYDYKSIVTKYFNSTGTLSTWYEGREVGELWGYTVYDLYRTQEELDNYLASVNLSSIATSWKTGDVKYEDTNNDGKVDNGKNTISDHGDLSKIGNTEPHYQYGITAGMSFKGFDFSMLWRGVAKKDIYFYSAANMFWGFVPVWYQTGLTPRNLDYFRDQPGTKYSGLYEGDANINTDAYWPRPYSNSVEQNKNTNLPNTRYLQDGSYLRLQNVQVGYSLPQRFISKLNLQKLRVYFSGENLITFTKLPAGIDPTALNSFVGLGGLTYGADRIYSLGISVTF